MRLSKFNLCAIGIFLTLGIFVTSKADGGIAQFNFTNKSTQKLAQTIPPPPPSALPVTEQEGPSISSKSLPAQVALATHLQTIKARMYGAYWCPYCHRQQEVFGKEAFTVLTYIECDPRGKNAQPELCQATNIKAYPTWQIRGKYYTGMQSLENLAMLSGYKGSRNFQEQVPSR